MNASETVVVGVDGSDGGAAALRSGGPPDQPEPDPPLTAWTGHTHACTSFPVSELDVQL